MSTPSAPGRALSLLALGLCGTLGCAPVVVWYGHSPDRSERVEVVESLAGQRVRIGGLAGPWFLGVAVETVTFSPDGRRSAYAAESELGWHLVVDGELGPPELGIGEVAFGPDGESVVYVAQSAAGWIVVRDGRRGLPFDAVLAGTLRWSPSGRHLAYAAEQSGRLVAVLDGRPGALYDGLASLDFAGPDGPLAYVGRRGERSMLVVDSAESEPFDAIGEVAYAAGHTAFAALREPEWVAVVDGTVVGSYDRVDALRLTADGRHHAYIAQRGGEQLVVRDRTESLPFRWVERASLQLSPAGRLAYAARGSDEPGVRMWLEGVPGPSFDRIEPPVFAAAGPRWGYVAERGGAYFVVIDGRPRGPYRWAGDLRLSSDGSHLAFVASRAGYAMVVHDEGGSALPSAVDGSLALDASGEHWACLAAAPGARGLHLVVDGRPRRAFDFAELVAALAKTPPEHRAAAWLEPAVVRRWVAAELELALTRAPRARGMRP